MWEVGGDVRTGYILHTEREERRGEERERGGEEM
jgi:hypothetical protein